VLAMNLLVENVYKKKKKKKKERRGNFFNDKEPS
jgi:hypothetical protein